MAGIVAVRDNTVVFSGASRSGRDVCSDDFRENLRASSFGYDDTPDALLYYESHLHERVRGSFGYCDVFAYAPHDRVRVCYCTSQNDRRTLASQLQKTSSLRPPLGLSY